MILQALVSLYDHLVEKGKLVKPGWQPVNVSWALQLSTDGDLKQIIPMKKAVLRGKKEVLVPVEEDVPAQKAHGQGIASNFLCDTVVYMLGIGGGGGPKRAARSFEDTRQHHIRRLEGVDSDTARAVVAFFRKWDPATAETHPAVIPFLPELLKGGNVVLMVGEQLAHKDEAIQKAWDDRLDENADAVRMRCLVTGEYSPIARLHPVIKGVRNAQAMGTQLVSFNAPAYESFGREKGQGLNAPVSDRAASAYGLALNYLLKDSNHCAYLGDMTIVYWAEDAEDAYAELFGVLLGNSNAVTDEDLKRVVRPLTKGQRVDWGIVPLEPTNRFYILGLSPNAARLSVRFFLSDTFGSFARHLQDHYDRMEIIRSDLAQNDSISFWHILNETVNQNSRDKKPSPQLAGDLARAVLLDGMYPATLYEQLEVRIRAEHNINWRKAAIIKAYFLKNTTGEEHDRNMKEALTVQLNEQTMYPPYVMGRLFAVLEGLQQAANPGINTTIRDRYFNSACATPASVFPSLIRLAQAHLKKLEGGLSYYYNSQLSELMNRMNEPYPARLSLQDQGIFQLGYYHQYQKRYQKKEDK